MTQIVCHLPLLVGLLLVTTENFRVNLYTSMDQKDPAVASDGNSRLICVWNSYRQDGDSGGIFARYIDVNGPIGNEFQVNLDSAGNQAEPAAAIAQDGRFLVCWRGPWPGQDEAEIAARLFDPNGQPAGPDMHLNQYTQGSQTIPRVAWGPQAGFVVVWESDQGPQSTRSCILGRAIDTDGNPIGGELVISDTPSYAARFPDVAVGPDGTIATCWLEDRTTDAIRLRLFDPNGNPKAGSAKVNVVGLRSLCRPTLAFLGNGDIVVAWDGDPNRATDDDIRARIVDPTGKPLTDEFIVNTTTPGPQQDPRIAITRDGMILVVWHGPSGDPNAGSEVFAKLIGPTGQQTGAEMILNDSPAGNQRSPVIASLGKELITIWEDDQQDGSGLGIFGGILSEPSQQPGGLPAD